MKNVLRVCAFACVLVFGAMLGGCQTLSTDLATAQADLAKVKATSLSVLNTVVKNCPAAVATTTAVSAALAQTATGSSTANDAATVAQATATTCAAAAAVQASGTLSP